MNFSIIKRTLGWLLLFEAIFLLVPTLTALAYQEWDTLWAILLSIAVCVAVGGLCFIGKPKNNSIYAREGLVIVAMSRNIASNSNSQPRVLLMIEKFICFTV